MPGSILIVPCQAFNPPDVLVPAEEHTGDDSPVVYTNAWEEPTPVERTTRPTGRDFSSPATHRSRRVTTPTSSKTSTPL